MIKFIITTILVTLGFFLVVQGAVQQSQLLAYAGGSILYVLGAVVGYHLGKE